MDIHVDGNFWFFGRRHSGKEPLSRFAQAWVSETGPPWSLPKCSFAVSSSGERKKFFWWNLTMCEIKTYRNQKMVFSKQKCKIKWEKNISTFGEAPICLCHFENSAFRVVLSFDRKHSLTASKNFRTVSSWQSQE